MSGYRATVVVEDPGLCPVATASTQVEEPVHSVARTRTATDGPVVEEFTVPSGESIDADAAELTPVQTTDRETVYRFDRDGAADCPCELVERTGTPVSSVQARNGALLLTVRLPALDDVTTIVEILRERFDGVVVEELTAADGRATDPVIVDRMQLTDRQREVIETAHEMGYFEYPKGANATDVATELGIARSTFTEHLAAAQTKLLQSIFQKQSI